jgi:hypothetical protein
MLTDTDGKFKLELSEKDTSFYFFHQNYKEIVCWNYGFKSQHINTVDFKATKKPETQYDKRPEKPVIYLYSDETTSADIFLQPKGGFTFTYPLYENGWNVNVSHEGYGILSQICQSSNHPMN